MADALKSPNQGKFLGFAMEDAIHGVQFFCLLVTVAFFATGILTSLKIKADGHVRDVNFLPFLLTFLNCALWSSYGYVIKDWVVTCVNFSGVVMQLGYILVYLRFLTDPIAKAACYRRVIIGLGFYMAVCFLVYVSDASISQQLFGLTCDCVTILMFASPLSTMGDVIRSQSTVSMSFLQSFMTLIVSTSWFFYGYLLKDLYIQVPNGLGAALGAVQLVLFLIYPSDQGVAKKPQSSH